LRMLFPELMSGIKAKFNIPKLLRFSMPILFIGFSFILLNQTSRIAIGYIGDSDSVGIYSVAANVTVLIVMFLDGVDGIFAPIMSDLFNKNKIQKLDSLFKTSTRWVVSFALPVATLYVLFAREIVGLFGTEYQTGWPIVVILAIAYLINASTGSVAFLLQMSGKQDIEMVNCITMAVISIALNIFLIGKYGIIGAAIATGACIAALNIIRLVEVKLLFDIQPYNLSFLKPLFSTVIMVAAFVLFFNHWPLPQIFWPLKAVCLFACYLIAMILLKFEDEDMSILVTIKNRLINRQTQP